MSLTATDKGGGDYELTPEGTYVARCYRIIDLGTQKSIKFGTDDHKVMISWELFDGDIKMADGRPFSVHNTYTVSLNEKANLRKHLEAWRGKKFNATELEGFDLSTVLGAYCMIQVVHSEDGQFANINSIMSFKGEKPVAVNKNILFDIDNPDLEMFETLGDNTKAKIMSAPEWQKSQPKVAPAPAKPVTVAKSVDNVTIEDIEPEEIPLDDIPF